MLGDPSVATERPNLLYLSKIDDLSEWKQCYDRIKQTLDFSLSYVS